MAVVPSFEFNEDVRIDAACSVDLFGSVGHEVERSTSKNRIGFRLKPTEAELDAEEWRLP